GIRRRAVSHNLGALVDDIEAGLVRPAEAQSAFRLAYVRWWLPATLDADPVLRNFRRFQHEHAIEDFREIDDLVRAQASLRVISAIAHGLPAVQGVPRNSELGLLRHQMELQRPSRSIREMIGAMPTSFAKLAPCMLMSPLSIAQYLPPDQALFDVVIFDEASQITTWDAVGAIARAHQTIIVGDPKQLPPTNFFGRNEEDEEVVEHEKDLESILDEAKAAGIPVRDLRWH
ncbi:DNA helicase, partial [Mesorhizobium sp. M3A.F.Ca.ET.201.01.1.1]